jgi:hypothetical protein
MHFQGAAVLRPNLVRRTDLRRPDSDGRPSGQGKSLPDVRFEWRGMEELLATRRLWHPFLAAEEKRRGVPDDVHAAREGGRGGGPAAGTRPELAEAGGVGQGRNGALMCGTPA